MKTKIRPLNSFVLVEVQKQEETKGGIILASGEQELDYAIVRAVNDQEVNIEVGDIVYFKGYSLDKIKIDDKELSFIKSEDILGKA